jgi:signal peptidase I
MFNEITGELLRCGNRVRFRAVGASMQPTIEDGELITVAPVEPAAAKRGDILLYRSDRGLIAHRLVGLRKSAKGEDVRYLLQGDASVDRDEPVRPEQVLGRVVAVQRGARSKALDTRTANILRLVRRGAVLVRSAIGLIYPRLLNSLLATMISRG